MRSWQTKAFMDGAKALLPFQQTLRHIKRRIVPYDTNPANDPGLLSDSVRQLQALSDADVTVARATIVEIGSGWKPILPLVYGAAEARHVTTVDQERLLDLRNVRAAADYILLNLQETATKSGYSLPLNLSRLKANSDNTATLDDILEANAIDYRAPYDFEDLAAKSADIVVSRDVLEHIPEKRLVDLMITSRRILKDGGTLCHTIDMSDHWEHADKSISRLNFLKYDGALWKLAGINRQNFQNRLRRYEYLALFRRHGFEVLSATGEASPAACEALQTQSLCPRYVDVNHAELAILNTTIVARKRGGT